MFASFQFKFQQQEQTIKSHSAACQTSYICCYCRTFIHCFLNVIYETFVHILLPILKCFILYFFNHHFFNCSKIIWEPAMVILYSLNQTELHNQRFLQLKKYKSEFKNSNNTQRLPPLHFVRQKIIFFLHITCLITN